MELTDREKDILQGLSATVKSTLSLIPGFQQAIAGYEGYKRSSFDRNLKNIVSLLMNKVEDLESFSSDEWIQSDEGQQFVRKVLDAAFDSQLEDKQELFINALINGVNEKETSNLEKLKFVDLLRNISLASLMVLSDMHNLYKDNTIRPGKSRNGASNSRPIDKNKIAEELSDKYHPYLTNSCIYEMESQGLFSNIHGWAKLPDGTFRSGSYFDVALTYTDFTCRFVEFITSRKTPKLDHS